MTDLEKEMMRQIHELDKELKQLRERVAVLEYRNHSAPTTPQFLPQPSYTPQFFPQPSYIVTYGGRRD